MLLPCFTRILTAVLEIELCFIWPALLYVMASHYIQKVVTCNINLDKINSLLTDLTVCPSWSKAIIRVMVNNPTFSYADLYRALWKEMNHSISRRCRPLSVRYWSLEFKVATVHRDQWWKIPKNIILYPICVINFSKTLIENVIFEGCFPSNLRGSMEKFWEKAFESSIFPRFGEFFSSLNTLNTDCTWLLCKLTSASQSWWSSHIVCIEP